MDITTADRDQYCIYRTISKVTPSPFDLFSLVKQKLPHLLGSKWTAQQKTLGWRHFHVANRKNQGKWVFAELVSACDPTVRFWINAKTLKNQQLWAAGWQTLGEIQRKTHREIQSDRQTTHL